MCWIHASVAFQRRGERLQVNFPEKAGALRQFLGAMCPAFNVTMFHYRSTGNRSSSVLLGLQVPPEREGHYLELVETLRPRNFTFEKLDEKTQAVFDEFIS
jgi:threonine dehydratase